MLLTLQNAKSNRWLSNKISFSDSAIAEENATGGGRVLFIDTEISDIVLQCSTKIL